jgi:hypothetical protein
MKWGDDKRAKKIGENGGLFDEINDFEDKIYEMGIVMRAKIQVGNDSAFSDNRVYEAGDGLKRGAR